MTEVKKNPTNADVYLLLGEIKGMLDGLVDMQTKVMLALIALAGATLGLKLVGSPPIQVAMFYLKVFIFIFTGLLAVAKRHVLGGWYLLLAFGLCAGAAQTIKLFTPGETIVSTLLFLAANWALLGFVWNWNGWRVARR